MLRTAQAPQVAFAAVAAAFAAATRSAPAATASAAIVAVVANVAAAQSDAPSAGAGRAHKFFFISFYLFLIPRVINTRRRAGVRLCRRGGGLPVHD